MRTDDVISDIVDGICMIGIVLLANPLCLPIYEEALHQRIVSTVAIAAHAANQTILGRQRLKSNQQPR